jgi:ATP-dependent helicase IRC3
MGFHALALEKLRIEDHARSRQTPFEHQIDAFAALNKCFNLDSVKGKAGLLVLPTGAGKTFTTVKWLSDNVLSRSIPVLWLAQSCYLLGQAFREFRDCARWIPEPRQTLNVRLVSSSPEHERPSSILLTDDVLVMTTQTAIKCLHSSVHDGDGTIVVSNFRRWLERAKDSGLFVVLDEAHHAPAHGHRSLLIGTGKSEPGIRQIVKKTNLLGLTATPTYTDKARRGWLRKVFDAGVIYQADKARLTVEGILARPSYIPRPTGREFPVSDGLYNRLVREHKDLPEDVIEKLAKDSRRNDAIVQEYVQNKNRYGKTLIFADRWFQCEYLKSKLRQHGIKADAVYSHIDADPDCAEGCRQRTASDNARIINEFRDGKDRQGRNKLAVIACTLFSGVCRHWRQTARIIVPRAVDVRADGDGCHLAGRIRTQVSAIRQRA